MSGAPSTFKERDLTRAVRAVLKAGLPVKSATVDNQGRITVLIGEGDDVSALQLNEWDQVLGAKYDPH